MDIYGRTEEQERTRIFIRNGNFLVYKKEGIKVELKKDDRFRL